ncbi:MAG: YIP1 family protein [Anaerolineaceae bacterium]|jgi:hypothetical protein|nr:YIP1 family protein [Anaerolineaceae bacterium]
MTLPDEINGEVKPSLKADPRWLLSIFTHPTRTLHEILGNSKAIWLWPVLLLSLLAVIRILVSGPIQIQSAQGIEVIPPDFQYYTPEQQEQFQSAISVNQGPVMVYVLPGLAAVLGVWLHWFLLGALLHLALTLNGSRSSNTAALNLTAWASLPLALREIVRIFSILFTHRLIQSPGLSGFASGGFLSALLAQIDAYFLWQIVLILIGALHISGMTRAKTWIVTLTTILIVMGLLAIPAYLVTRLSGIGAITPFF